MAIFSGTALPPIARIEGSRDSTYRLRNDTGTPYTAGLKMQPTAVAGKPLTGSSPREVNPKRRRR